MNFIQKTEFKAGDIVMVTEGFYSSWGPMGSVKVIKDFTLKETLSKYLLQYPEQGPRYKFNADGFFLWLVTSGYTQEFERDEIELHLGDYQTHPLWQD